MTKIIFTLLFTLVCLPGVFAGDKSKALIIDGQNNHAAWPKSTIMLKQYLEDTGRFEVSVERTRYTWKADKEAEYLPLANAGTSQDLPEPKADPGFAPEFGEFDVVISNFGNRAAHWPDSTRRAFEQYVSGGGGFVSVHAANNSFGDWPEYNRMIGLGGWGGRNEESGPHVFYSNAGELIREQVPGKSGVHGPRHEIPITVREFDHPITRGMPQHWLTTRDECYAMLRGPAENLTILATGKDSSGKAPTDRHEPMLMVVDYNQGRVFHTTLGHDALSSEGVGFIISFTRGVEWAATGKVTQAIPDDFPSSDKATRRPFVVRR